MAMKGERDIDRLVFDVPFIADFHPLDIKKPWLKLLSSKLSNRARVKSRCETKRIRFASRQKRTCSFSIAMMNRISKISSQSYADEVELSAGQR
jgi:hypothetical protein